ncbi:MAG: 16S rRNA (uracil(1498)-N(3))-methyltransferase [Nitrospirae bacterium]|nr:16S rRNA (uracil(1498)-N(3))-methyltransferase [Nitrospirota bacterium]
MPYSNQKKREIARIYVPHEDIEINRTVRLSSEKSYYLRSVLRCRQGDRIIVMDGKSRAYEAEVVSIKGDNVSVSILHALLSEAELPFDIVLCQGILKGEKMDMVIEKCTELGVKEIVPLISERCVLKKTRKLPRWRKIAEEAAEQCGRAAIPRISEPIEFRAFFEKYNRPECAATGLECLGSMGIRGLIFWEEGGSPLKEAIEKICSPSDQSTAAPIYHYIIGPEGGFTYDEVRLAEKSGLIRTTLGSRILRAETAAIVSTALIQFLLESAIITEKIRGE